MIFYTNMAYFGKITFIIGHNFVIKRSELVFLLYLNIKSKAFFMRKVIVMFVLLFLSVGAWAQYAGSGTIRRVGSHIEMDGERLSPEARTALLADICGQDFNPVWEKARKGRNTGLGLVIGGGVAVIGGGASLLIGATASVIGAAVGGTVGSIGGQESSQHGAEEGARAGKPLITAGLITAGLGIVSAGVGIPLLVKSNKTLSGVVDTYNNGIGLALRF